MATGKAGVGVEIDLLSKYPKAKRDVSQRAQTKTEAQRQTARQFGKDFFDGSRDTGYGGFHYSPHFWQPVIPDFVKQYSLNSGSSVLDVGCAKGFMLFDLTKALPGVTVSGVDISDYAISHSRLEVKNYLQVADAKALPFEDNSFDLVLSINTIHNLDKAGCGAALREIERVSRGNSYITVDAYRNEAEYQRMMDWNLTAQTIMSTDDWVKFFKAQGYTGDYYWFIP